MTDHTTIALLGTGTMGAGMARCIAAAGLPLRVWNRTPARAEPLADVARVCGDVAEAVTGADIVVTMLYDADSVASAMEQARGSLGPDVVWVQSSTVGVPGAARLADLAADLGVAYVDAPVLGTRKPAADGALVVLASGDQGLLPVLSALFDAIGNRTLWVGEVGAGSRLKLACNAWVATVLQGVAESLAMTRAFGLDPALFLDAVRGGPLDAPYVQVKGKAMLAGDHEPSFQLAGALKDVDLMIEALGGTDFEPGLVPAIRERFAAAVEQGHGAKDMSATYLGLYPTAG